MKIDTTFVIKLLSTSDPRWNGLRILMNKWEKLYPGTTKLIVDMTVKRSISRICKILLLIFLSIMASILLISMSYFTRDTNAFYCGIGILLGVVIITWVRIDLDTAKPLPVHKDIRTDGFQNILNEIEHNLYSLSIDREKDENYLDFDKLRKICNDRVLSYVNEVIRHEIALKNSPSNQNVLEITHFLRLKLNKFHKMFSSVGLLNDDLGMYYKNAEQNQGGGASDG